jgi:hypothetical protein
MVDGVLDDVLERVAVLLLGFDHLRPEALAEDMVLAAVPRVEGASVLAVEVAHAVGEVRLRGLDEQVVMVAHEAADVEPPAVSAQHTPEDLDEGAPVVRVAEDRRVVVPFRGDVVVGTGGEVALWPSHPVDRSRGVARDPALCASRRSVGAVRSRARQRTGLERSVR